MSTLMRVHRWLTMPILQALIVAAVIAVLSFWWVHVQHRATTMMGQCSVEITNMVKSGEKALLLGRVDEAHSIANDAIAIAPNCASANTLEAAVNAQQMTTLTRKSDPVAWDEKRSACYIYASKAIEASGHNPRVDALLEACATPPSSASAYPD